MGTLWTQYDCWATSCFIRKHQGSGIGLRLMDALSNIGRSKKLVVVWAFSSRGAVKKVRPSLLLFHNNSWESYDIISCGRNADTRFVQCFQNIPAHPVFQFTNAMILGNEADCQFHPVIG